MSAEIVVRGELDSLNPASDVTRMCLLEQIAYSGMLAVCRTIDRFGFCSAVRLPYFIHTKGGQENVAKLQTLLERVRQRSTMPRNGQAGPAVAAASPDIEALPATPAVIATAFVEAIPEPPSLLEEAAAAGLTDVVLVTGQDSEAFRSYFGPAHTLERVLAERGDHAAAAMMRTATSEVAVAFLTQDAPRGLGDAVLRCAV